MEEMKDFHNQSMQESISSKKELVDQMDKLLK